jgi:signal transduction histidine kinase/ActR/RegA family two-component response regulator
VTEQSSQYDERFLVVAPTGRDGALTASLLQRQGIACRVCDSIDELCRRFEAEGAAGLMLAEEALVRSAVSALEAMLARQPPWSDLPVLLFTSAKTSWSARDPTRRTLEALGNVTLLERPLRPITMLSAASSALRTRRRQYMARAELQAEQRAVRARDQFLAMLGHELRNPLSAIALANSLDSDPRVGHRQDVIGRQVHHLMRLVDDLLDVSRVTSGKIHLKRELVDLCHVVESSLASTRPVIAAQQLELAVSVPSATPLVVNGDPVRLEQVLVNLLSNAAKYTPVRGRIELEVKRSDGHAVVEVRDDGVGIAPEMLDRVFDLFMQADGSLDRAQGGLGIGLTLVRNLIEMHGGTVRAKSDGLGKGSAFELRLPLAAAKAGATTRSSTPPAADGGKNKRPRAFRMLLIEDNADSRELLALLLERLGHRVFTADDGVRGLADALQQRPQVLLVDIGLPGMDGYAVARRVRAELGRSVYLIALTGYGQPEDRKRALDAGFDAHFTKPVDMKAIEKLLHSPELAVVEPS